jgi:hypothetical protein
MWKSQLEVEFRQTFHPRDLVSSASGNLLHCDVVNVIGADRQTNLMVGFGTAGLVLVVLVLAMMICQMLKKLKVRGNLVKVD